MCFLLSFSCWGIEGKSLSDRGAQLVAVRPKELTSVLSFLSHGECLTERVVWCEQTVSPRMAWRPKRGKYGGENEYSIWPHKPNSVGATPTSATKLPNPLCGDSYPIDSGEETQHEVRGEWLGRPTRDCKGLPVVTFTLMV